MMPIALKIAILFLIVAIGFCVSVGLIQWFRLRELKRLSRLFGLPDRAERDRLRDQYRFSHVSDVDLAAFIDLSTKDGESNDADAVRRAIEEYPGIYRPVRIAVRNML